MRQTEWDGFDLFLPDPWLVTTNWRSPSCESESLQKVTFGYLHIGTHWPSCLCTWLILDWLHWISATHESHPDHPRLKSRPLRNPHRSGQLRNIRGRWSEDPVCIERFCKPFFTSTALLASKCLDMFRHLPPLQHGCLLSGESNGRFTLFGIRKESLRSLVCLNVWIYSVLLKGSIIGIKLLGKWKPVTPWTPVTPVKP